jgi:hypothetical protein
VRVCDNTHRGIYRQSLQNESTIMLRLNSVKSLIPNLSAWPVYGWQMTTIRFWQVRSLRAVTVCRMIWHFSAVKACSRKGDDCETGIDYRYYGTGWFLPR